MQTLRPCPQSGSLRPSPCCRRNAPIDLNFPDRRAPRPTSMHVEGCPRSDLAIRLPGRSANAIRGVAELGRDRWTKLDSRAWAGSRRSRGRGEAFHARWACDCSQRGSRSFRPAPGRRWRATAGRVGRRRHSGAVAPLPRSARLTRLGGALSPRSPRYRPSASLKQPRRA